MDKLDSKNQGSTQIETQKADHVDAEDLTAPDGPTLSKQKRPRVVELGAHLATISWLTPGLAGLAAFAAVMVTTGRETQAIPWLVAGGSISIFLLVFGYLQGNAEDKRKIQADAATLLDLISGIGLYRKFSYGEPSNTDKVLPPSAKDRLIEEVGDLKRRASLNMALGSVATLLAIIVLAAPLLWSIYSPAQRPPVTQFVELAHEWGPRLALAIFAQLFAFFFLRMYRASLAEIRHSTMS